MPANSGRNRWLSEQNTFGRKCTEGPCHSPRRNQLPPNRSGLTQPGGYPVGSRQSPLTGGPRLAVTSSHPIQYALRLRCGRLVGLRASHCAELTSSKLGRAIGILCYDAFQHRDCLFVRPEIRRESEVVPVEIVSFLAFWAGTVSMKLPAPRIGSKPLRVRRGKRSLHLGHCVDQCARNPNRASPA